MPRLLVILLVSWAYVGCGARGVSPAKAPPELRGGVVRIAVDSSSVAQAVLVGAVADPLVAAPQPQEAAEGAPPARGHCRWFGFDPPARDPSGVPVLPQDIVVELERRLRDPRSAVRWLLSPVDGAADFADGRGHRVAGLTAEGAFLALCSAAPLPDLDRRMTHPELQYWRRDASGLAHGPGPYLEEDSVSLIANPYYAGAPPRIRRIDRVGTPGAAHVLVELGEADVALLYGESADRLLAAPPASLDLSRSPAWDRWPMLWLNPRARWLNDPRFRRWVAGLLDRPAMLDYLFAGRGEPARDLLHASPGEASHESVFQRPVGSSSVPRFALSFDAADRHAERLAARIKATLRAERVQVTLVPTPRDELSRRLKDGRVQAAVLPGGSFFEDPLLALRETCAQIGPSADPAAQVLDQASSLSAPEDRWRAALAAQDILLSEALVIPLLRVHAWLATRRDLVGVRAGPRRVLQFHEAGWRR